MLNNIVRTRFLFHSHKNSVKFRYKHTWIKPEGTDTGIKMFSCVTKNKEALIMKNEHFLSWYTCGPTVYDVSHIGHACCYVKIDIIQKLLRNYFKLNLVTVMNITDIDDKIINKASETSATCSDVAKKYEREFWMDLKDLGISEPNVILRVTENINLIIDFILKLETNGQAYKAKDNSVYFDVESCGSYGKLQNIGTKEIGNSDIKKSNMDFALWKSSKADEQFWRSPWGNGRPGWHIECSALASHVLGSNIDIHAGGIDLRFPHHENEEAQSCAFHNASQWVNYWLHVGYLHLKSSEKMSKSLKNVISIQDMLKVTTPEAFRMACIMSSYRNNMEYSKELLMTAEHVIETFSNFFRSCDAFKKGYLKSSVNTGILSNSLGNASYAVYKALCDDFDTPSVIKILNDLISVTNSMLYSTASADDRGGISCIIAVENFCLNILNALGLNFTIKADKSEDFTEIINILNDFRQNVRVIGLSEKHSDILNLCDTVRDNLKNCGIIIKDHGKLSSWNR